MKRIILKLVGVSLMLITCAISLSICFASWVTSGGEGKVNEVESNVVRVGTSVAVCFNSNTNEKYSSIETALSEANSNNSDSIYVYPGLKNPDGTTYQITINQDTTIKQNVSLYLPHNYDQDTDTYLCDIPSDQASTVIPTLTNGVKDTNADNVKTYRTTLVALRNGANLTIASGGKLYIGGSFYQSGNNGKYAEINLGKDSKIISNGSIYNYGYIKEDNSTLNQSSNAGIQVNAGYLYSYLGVYDMKGGSALTSLIEKDQCPIQIFDFPGLQTKYSINYSAYFYAKFRYSMTVSGQTKNINDNIGVCAPSSDSSNNAMFKSSSGNVTFNYARKRNLYTVNNTTVYTDIQFNGNCSLGKFYLDVSIDTIDTSKYFMPISYRLRVRVSNNSTFTVSYKVKILAGSYLVIDSGSTLSVSSSIIAYKSSSQSNLTGYGINYPAGLDDAYIENNGTLLLNSSGTIGGMITTNKTDNSAVLNFSNVGVNKLYTTSYEGTSNKKILLFAEGYANFGNGNEICQFNGNTTINSSSVYARTWNTSQCVETISLSVSVAEVSFTNWVFSYDLQINTTASSSNSIVLETACTISTSFNIAKGRYLNLSINRAKSAVIINPTGLSFSNTSWYTANEDYEIEVTPNEAINLLILNSQTNSGSGKITASVTESLNGSSNFYTIAEGFNTITSSAPLKVIKDAYFKISCDYKFDQSGTTWKYTFDSETMVIGENTYDHKSSPNTVYHATDNATLTRTGGSASMEQICVSGNTLVTMSDGSQKMIKDVQLGELVKTWSFVEGAFVNRPIIWYESGNMKQADVVTLVFDDGSRVESIWKQSFFDADLLDYVTVDSCNYSDFIGRRLLADTGNTSIGTKRVVDAFVETKDTEYYEIDTMYEYQYLANSILTIEPTLHNHVWFEVTPDFKYDEAKMAADLQLYGPLDYELVKDLVTYDQYLWWGGEYLAVPIGKGYFDLEYLIKIIKQFINENYEVA